MLSVVPKSASHLFDGITLGTKDPIVDSIQALSPKRVGVFTEAFLCSQYGFDKSEDIYCDAKNDSGNRIEIKASRVLIDHIPKKGEGNLLDVLENDARMIPKYQDIFDNAFTCNIQQIKTDLFHDLHYMLILADCILEFKISSKEIIDILEARSIRKEMMKIINTKYGHHPEICDFLSDYLDGKTKLSAIYQVTKKNYDRATFRKLNHLIETKKNFAYSNKQHKGNNNEGQFHINEKNVKFHIENYLVNVYNYSTFKTTLKNISA